VDPGRVRPDVSCHYLARVGPGRGGLPLLWGTGQHIDKLFGGAIATVTSQPRTAVFRCPSPEAFAAFFRRWYGPALMAFEALDETGRARLESDPADLVRRSDRNRDGGSVALPRPTTRPCYACGEIHASSGPDP